MKLADDYFLKSAFQKIRSFKFQLMALDKNQSPWHFTPKQPYKSTVWTYVP